MYVVVPKGYVTVHEQFVVSITESFVYVFLL
jgi:hypothetical protein